MSEEFKGEIREAEREPKKVSLQEIYDLRELTGFISGKDLHDFFHKLVGDPSPSGNVEVDEDKLTQTKMGKKVLDLLNSPLREHLADLREEMEKAVDSVNRG